MENTPDQTGAPAGPIAPDKPREPVPAALGFVAMGPPKTQAWINEAAHMCRFCEGAESVDQAAARILAAEVRRLRGICEHAHDRLLRGDSDREILEMLQRGWQGPPPPADSHEKLAHPVDG